MRRSFTFVSWGSVVRQLVTKTVPSREPGLKRRGGSATALKRAGNK